MENLENDFYEVNLNNNSSGNILIELNNSAFFNVGMLDKYGVAIFKNFPSQSNDLKKAIAVLNEFVKLDPEGKSLISQQRVRIKKIVERFVGISYRFDEIIRNFEVDINNLNRLNYNRGEVASDYEAKVADDMTKSKIASINKVIDENLGEFMSALQDGLNSISSQIFLKYSSDFSKYNDELNLSVIHIEKQKELVEKLVSDAALVPTKVEINNYSQVFEQEANRFNQLAYKWFLSIIAIIVVSAMLAIFNIYVIVCGLWITENLNEIIQLNLSKLLLLTCLFYMLSICIRNYKSCKHNQIVNEHRKTALSSFQAFANAASADSATKNAVLLEVTRTIFGSQQTGYIDGDKEESPNKIIEIFKSVQSK